MMIYLHSYQFPIGYFHDFIHNGVFYSVSTYYSDTKNDYFMLLDNNKATIHGGFEYVLPTKLRIIDYMNGDNRDGQIQESVLLLALNSI